MISAKGLNPRLQVVARASSRETEEKLLRAGADCVVTPYTIGGQRMALGLLQPAVNEFLNSVVFDAEKHTDLRCGDMLILVARASNWRELQNIQTEKRESPPEAGFLLTIPATTYSPTQSPMQYHWRNRA